MKRVLQSLLKSSVSRRIQSFWKTLTANWSVYLETPVPVEELTDKREAASIPSFGFFFLLICATVLATLGLLSNSNAVIIGAMIVAPLMNPILSMSFAIVTANWVLYKRSLMTVALGALSAILVSFGLAVILPVNLVDSEVIARSSPSLMDFGVAIAAGAAGAFSLTRHSIASSITGVAIAVALVPPLCVVGIGLGLGENLIGNIDSIALGSLTVSGGAFLLFLSNLAGITFTACLVFLSQSYGSLSKAFKTLLVWLLILISLGGPLSNPMQEFVIKSRVVLKIREFYKDAPKDIQDSQVRHVGVKLEGKNAYISVTVIALENSITEEFLKNKEEQIFQVTSRFGVRSMDLDITVVPVKRWNYRIVRKRK
ncbi:MAG: DUF389 domain-containing protein [Cyanobacteria bacterium P01_H01_bin.15]